MIREINKTTSILEERFNEFNDWGLDDEFVEASKPWEDSGYEKDDYFETQL